MLEAGFGAMGATAQADILFELGMMYATGRDCETDVVAAHKWFNIAAIKGSARAAELRSELSAAMSKVEIAKDEEKEGEKDEDKKDEKAKD